MTEIAKRSEKIPSKTLAREVLACRWGTFGQPVIVFPTAGGDAEEIERMKMLVALRPLVEAGKVKVYSVDSVGGQALTTKGRTTASFARAQNLFDEFLVEKLVPWIRADCGGQALSVWVAGASIGAYNAAAAVCRHPDVFSKAIAMSGTFDLTKWLEPPYSTDYYFTSPMHFVPNLPDGAALAALRRCWIAMPTGSGPWEEPQQSWRLAHVLGSKGVPNRVDDWGPNYDHNWTTWREMLPKYLGEMTAAPAA